jgi:hypothetical protein
MAAVAIERPLERLQPHPLPDGGYICVAPCLATVEHSHCECGLPRRKGKRWCYVCQEERARRKHHLSPNVFLLRLADALSGSRR